MGGGGPADAGPGEGCRSLSIGKSFAGIHISSPGSQRVESQQNDPENSRTLTMMGPTLSPACRPGRRPFPAILAAGCLAAGAVFRAGAAESGGLPAVAPHGVELAGYARISATDAVSRLVGKLEGGKAVLTFDRDAGYLLSLLRALEIPRSSQLLVYSKTSLQRYHISTTHPRAVYWNEDTYVAWIPSAPMIEVMSVDPQLGAVFYTLAQSNVPNPRLVREDRCLECHVASQTLGVPGVLVRSFATSADGEVDLLSGGITVSHRTPLTERWGGWYVSGEAPGTLARGGGPATSAIRAMLPASPADPNLAGMPGQPDLSVYPEAGSDIVSLLVLDHQSHLENLLIRLRYESAASLRTHGDVRDVAGLIERVLQDVLFVGEAPLVCSLEGAGEFQTWFESEGPRDGQGRSLRQFDLKSRLFRYPCSYMVYSPLFTTLPRETHLHFYKRLHDVLTGVDSSPAYSGLSATDRRAILEILAATSKDLPAYWDL